ncbi:chromosome segregation protein SMC [Pseudaminobacter sp. 19-2017]|uniref:Chromosome partition protein Smc n=1 Tax=Pseudaminobacter soli (ex Zhang et al. 2022) TaxID=2831468 RepID=A0A942I1K9_9HYPH|nr:chromosome segregation protein SMC [Pseudaminobacter soli]MBS3648227.1 chromosome segregation protein SMC [Pseudaminobacter soli]
MKFSRLRLLGFKSFVEPGEFVIERGLTGIVGPNGCGKSNLVEALRWVMGESSYKNMRASGMDDVIFSGSGTRPARNTAEVTLFLDNTDRTAPVPFNDADELQVSRRIEREAGSVYRINGKEARARDVQLLFADQSTGARSPSMVGQGRIGELIQAKPQARRALLEEAAGISGLHTRRHEAELRLRAAEQNLERLDDVVAELESQIDNLRRQARQATRFKNLSAEIRKAEATLLHLRWTAAKAQEAEAQSALTAATSRVAECAAAQMEAAKAQAVGAHHLPALRDASAAASATYQRLSIARTQLDEEAQRIGARMAELERRLAQLAADIAREDQMVRDNADVLAKLSAEEETLRAEEDGSSEREEERQEALERATEALTESEAALSALTSERAEAVAAIGQADRALREATERRDRLARQLAEVAREETEVAARIGALADPAEKRAAAEYAAEEAEAAEEAVIGAETEVTKARGAEAAARPPVQEARAAFARIETEARTLAKVLSAASSGEFPAVLEQIAADRGYETALGAALGEDLDIPLDSRAPAYWGESSDADNDPALPEGIASLAGFVRAPAQLARRLAQIGIVEEAEGARIQRLLKPGQRVVTRKGALWRWDGFVAGADAPTAAAQRLAQKNRLLELEAEADQAAERVKAAESSLAAVEAAVKANVESEKHARDKWRNAQKAVADARDDLVRAERAAGELSARRAAIAETSSRISTDLAEAENALTEAGERRAALPVVSALQAKLDESARTVARDRAAVSDARASHDGLKREAAVRARRLETIAAERKSWISRAENAEAQIASLAERRAETDAELQQVAEAPGEIEERRRSLLSELSKADEARKQAADALQHAESRQVTLDKAATEAIQALAASREERGRAEERLTAADDRRREVEARIREALNIEPHLVARMIESEPGAKLPEIAEVERQLERAKSERERLGAVNLRAEEEQKELSDRLETIVSEREDVLEAIRKLRQAIQSLNREGRERLLAAFDVVNAEFKRLFTHLFGGGTAELQLIESDDPLQAGLEILARPPGKKPQTMTLLSGGEQALTAMALIFAVFLTNPAPICVLDEVDAPLDDHNVERFCNLMDEMARTTETRFVIITHNPITMARMDRLFGVTMAEQGVSTLVSVDLQAAERMREAG